MIKLGFGNIVRGVLTVAFAATVSVASADVLCLKDGRIYQDIDVSRDGANFVINFENGIVKVDGEQVLEAVLLNDTGYEPKSDEEREMIASGKVLFDGKWVSVSRRDKLLSKRLEEQQELVDEMKRTSVWRNRIHEETKNFAFEVTIPANVFEELRDLVEIYFASFAKTFKVKRPRSIPKLPLRWYSDYDQFLQVSGMPRGVMGFFTFVTPLDLNLFYDRLDRKGTEEVMYHEVGHFLHKLFDVDFKYPHWPGESLCEYYAASTYDPVKKKLTTGGIQEGRLTQIQNDIARGEWIHVKEMILGCQDRNFEDYSWGWSFVHYLMSNKKYAKKFTKFFPAIALAKDIKRVRQQFTPKIALKTVEGEELLRAFKKYMGFKTDADLMELEKEWHEYITSELVVASATGLADAAYRNYRSGRPKKALRLFGEAVEAGDLRAIDLHRYADLLNDEGEKEKAITTWRQAIAADPLTAEFYVSLGESILSGANDDDELEKEGRRLLKLSLEIAPDDPQVEKRVKKALK
ncbi:MAG: tetratricopeptide (TPR) repeat protein [Planctomycetota bacterium]|jgi:tetratricopeptide (TPR) repeat protein